MAQMLTITMMLADDAIRLPDYSEEFRGYLEGYAVILLALCSEHNQAVQDYRANILDCRSEIITYIEQMFPNLVHCHTAWAVVLMYIYCMMNDYLTRLLTAQPPTITGTPAVGAPPVAPDLSYIAHGGQWLGPMGSSGAGDGGSSSGTGGGGGRPERHVIVQHPNQTPQSSRGHGLPQVLPAFIVRGLPSVTSESMPNKKCIIQSDTLGS